MSFKIPEIRILTPQSATVQRTCNYFQFSRPRSLNKIMKLNKTELRKQRLSFTPVRNDLRSPNLSPIFNFSPDYIKDFTNHFDKNVSKRNDSYYKKNNSILNKTLTVDTILKDFKMEQYLKIFHEQEINTLEVFFTLSDADLENIGIKNKMHRHIIIDAIKLFDTENMSEIFNSSK